jgi:hypothetical protein
MSDLSVRHAFAHADAPFATADAQLQPTHLHPPYQPATDSDDVQLEVTTAASAQKLHIMLPATETVRMVKEEIERKWGIAASASCLFSTNPAFEDELGGETVGRLREGKGEMVSLSLLVSQQIRPLLANQNFAANDCEPRHEEKTVHLDTKAGSSVVVKSWGATVKRKVHHSLHSTAEALFDSSFHAHLGKEDGNISAAAYQGPQRKFLHPFFHQEPGSNWEPNKTENDLAHVLMWEPNKTGIYLSADCKTITTLQDGKVLGTTTIKKDGSILTERQDGTVVMVSKERRRNSVRDAVMQALEELWSPDVAMTASLPIQHLGASGPKSPAQA